MQKTSESTKAESTDTAKQMRDNPYLAKYAHLADPAETGKAIAEEKTREDARGRERVAAASAALESMIGKRYADCCLANFVASGPKQRAVIGSLEKIDLAGLIREGKGLVFYGPVGTGKDHLLAAMLFRASGLSPRASVRWINGLELLGRFRDGISNDANEASAIASFVAPDVLAISDPCPPISMRDEAWRIEILYRVLDARYRAQKSTWITINANDPEEADGKLTSPVWDRIQDGAELFACCWPSYREKKKCS